MISITISKSLKNILLGTAKPLSRSFRTQYLNHNRFPPQAARKSLSLKMSSSSHSSPHVLVPIGNGSEEIEATTIIDTLVRGGAVVFLFITYLCYQGFNNTIYI